MPTLFEIEGRRIFSLCFFDGIFFSKRKQNNIVQEVMQKWVLKFGDANVKQKDPDTNTEPWACLLGS